MRLKFDIVHILCYLIFTKIIELLLYKMRLIGQKELVKIAVKIEISVFMAILSCF